MALRTYHMPYTFRSWGCGGKKDMILAPEESEVRRVFTIPVTPLKLVSLVGRGYIYPIKEELRLQTLISGGLIHYKYISKSYRKGKQSGARVRGTSQRIVITMSRLSVFFPWERRLADWSCPNWRCYHLFAYGKSESKVWYDWTNSISQLPWGWCCSPGNFLWT